MSGIYDNFISKKKAESAFISLEDGESIDIAELVSVKLVTKSGFGGEEKEVLRLKCRVKTSEGDRFKDFDNGTQRFAQELKDKEVEVGCGFTLTRAGLQTKTRYTISNVTSPNSSLPEVKVDIPKA